LLPTRCFACDEPLGRFQRSGACAGCWADLELLAAPFCSGCGLPAEELSATGDRQPARCPSCARRPPAIDRVRALVIYENLARRFLLRAKLGSRPEILEELGRHLARVVEIEGLAEDCQAVVPVPSHPWITLRRGFSPARELARPVARRLGLPLRGWVRRRLGTVQASKRLGARQRRQAAHAAFLARPGATDQGILLIDDVMTTGATLGGCARALKAVGARSVQAAVWARTLPR
jgi:predicted amidophosphoribosyltransferase